jgi:BirA family biotin operon repressor/biotin-[acetyl-CoA-carboxylase] ligase
VLDIEKGGFAGFAVGIGINLSTQNFPEDISGIAASLGTNADKNEIAAGIARELFAFAENLSARKFLPEYRERSYVTGKDIYFMKNGEKSWSFMPIFSEKGNGSILTIQKNYGIIVK